MIATIAVTSRCPHNCFHCSEGYKQGYETPTDALARTIDDIVRLGCPAIAFTGGEPLLRKDLFEIMDRIPLSVMKVLYTSGMGLTDEQAKELGRRDNLVVCLSLDHSDSKEHDRRRGRKGSYDSVMTAIEKLAGTKAEIHVATLTSRDRVLSGELADFALMLKKKGVTCVQMFQPRPVGKLDYGDDVFLRSEDEEEVKKIAGRLNDDPAAPMILSYPTLEAPESLGCCGGYGRVYIDSHGHVCPCDFAPLSFGNINDHSFAEIWEKMRGFYRQPGSQCQVLNNPVIFEMEREGRNVEFDRLEDPSPLRSDPPGYFARAGEKAYRILLANIVIASMAFDPVCSNGSQDG